MELYTSIKSPKETEEWWVQTFWPRTILRIPGACQRCWRGWPWIRWPIRWCRNLWFASTSFCSWSIGPRRSWWIAASLEHPSRARIFFESSNPAIKLLNEFTGKNLPGQIQLRFSYWKCRKFISPGICTPLWTHWLYFRLETSQTRHLFWMLMVPFRFDSNCSVGQASSGEAEEGKLLNLELRTAHRTW